MELCDAPELIQDARVLNEALTSIAAVWTAVTSMGWKGRRLAERSSHRLERSGLRALLKHYREREPF
jgi:hypothetical protein